MSRNQNAGPSHDIEIDNRSFERVKEFKYLGTKPTNQSSIQEEIYKNITLPVVSYGCENLSLT